MQIESPCSISIRLGADTATRLALLCFGLGEYTEHPPVRYGLLNTTVGHGLSNALRGLVFVSFSFSTSCLKRRCLDDQDWLRRPHLLLMIALQLFTAHSENDCSSRE